MRSAMRSGKATAGVAEQVVAAVEIDLGRELDVADGLDRADGLQHGGAGRGGDAGEMRLDELGEAPLRHLVSVRAGERFPLRAVLERERGGVVGVVRVEHAGLVGLAVVVEDGAD